MWSGLVPTTVIICLSTYICHQCVLFGYDNRGCLTHSYSAYYFKIKISKPKVDLLFFHSLIILILTIKSVRPIILFLQSFLIGYSTIYSRIAYFFCRRSMREELRSDSKESSKSELEKPVPISTPMSIPLIVNYRIFTIYCIP